MRLSIAFPDLSFLAFWTSSLFGLSGTSLPSCGRLPYLVAICRRSEEKKIRVALKPKVLSAICGLADRIASHLRFTCKVRPRYFRHNVTNRSIVCVPHFSLKRAPCEHPCSHVITAVMVGGCIELRQEKALTFLDRGGVTVRGVTKL